jgi:hypothetical protein
MSEEAVSSSRLAISGFNSIKIFDDKCVTALLTILIMVVGAAKPFGRGRDRESSVSLL